RNSRRSLPSVTRSAQTRRQFAAERSNELLPPRSFPPISCRSYGLRRFPRAARKSCGRERASLQKFTAARGRWATSGCTIYGTRSAPGSCFEVCQMFRFACAMVACVLPTVSSVAQDIPVPGALVKLIDQLEVPAQEAGAVVMLDVQEGAHVTEGTLLVRLDD